MEITRRSPHKRQGGSVNEYQKEKETNMKCPSCDYPHMDCIGLTKDGFPKYKCNICKAGTDESPRNIAVRRKIDNKFREENPNYKSRKKKW